MDGNGRWAKARNKPRIEGHRQGVSNVKEILKGAKAIGLRCLTLFAFSVENWKRPPGEVAALMEILERFLGEQAEEFDQHGVRFRPIGRIHELPPAIYKLLKKAEADTRHFERYTLSLALNYGSRTEVVDAMRAYALAVAEGREDPDQLDWDRARNYFYTNDLPDPDLIIRTSGEHRVSNFLLLQGAYAEYFFSPKFWPDFGKEDLLDAVHAYQSRQRRFGLTGEQVQSGSAVLPQ